MADVQISDFSDGAVSQDDVVHINEAGLDRKITIAVLATHIEGELSHDSISGSGTNTHAQLDTHLADATKHRVINDAGSAVTDLWSADKITSHAAAQTHDTSSIVTGTFADARVAQSNVTQHEAAIDHDALTNFVASEHIDWTADAGADNLHNNNVVVGNVTQHQASIDHDLLTNFVADEHIAHSGVVLTAGVGLTGTGDLTASRTFDFDASTLTPITVPVAADVLPLYDNGVGQRSITFANLEANLNHDSLTGFVANEHIDHTAVSILTVPATGGISGGGTIAASRTLSVDINSLTADATPDEAVDYVMIYDASASGLKKVLLTDLPITETVNIQNEGSNVGVGGIDIYKGMNGLNLEMRSINSASSKISVALDAANNEVDLDIVEGNVEISNLLNAGTMATQDASGVAITGGTTDSVVQTNVDINSGAVDATPVGAASAHTGRFTSLEATGTTTVLDAAAAQSPATIGQLQSGAPFYYVAGGTADDITFTTAPVLGAVASGQPFLLKIATSNTGAVTIARDGLTADDLNLLNGQSLLAGHLLAGGFYWVAHDGVDYSLLNPSPVLDGAYVKPGAVTSLTTGVTGAIAFNQEDYDTRGYHSNVTNPSRLTIPTGAAGYYEFSGSLGIVSNSTNKRVTSFLKGGVATAFSNDDDAPVGTYKRAIVHPAIFLSAGDYFELAGFQNSGGSLNTINVDSALSIKRAG